MKVLAFDTVSSSFSIALMNENEICEINLINIENHNAQLLKNLDLILTENKVKIEEINLISLGIGPGSFTALRIALSTLKAISYSLKIPIIGISSLNALYKNIENEKNIKLALIGARKNSVYAQIYEDERIIAHEIDLNIDDLFLLLKENSSSKKISVVGDGYIKNKDFIDSKALLYGYELKNYEDNIIHAKNILTLALRRFENNEKDDIFTLLPNYLRESEAQMKKKY